MQDNNVFKVIDDENDETRLMLYACILNASGDVVVNNRIFISDWIYPNYSEHDKVVYQTNNLFLTTNRFDYKIRLKEAIKNNYNDKDIVCQKINDMKAVTNDIVKNYIDLDNMDFCYYLFGTLVWHLVGLFRRNNKFNSIALLNSNIEILFKNSVNHHQLRKNICIYLLLRGYIEFNDTMVGYIYTNENPVPVPIENNLLCGCKNYWLNRNIKAKKLLSSEAFKNLDLCWLEQKITKELTARNFNRETFLDLNVNSDEEKRANAVVYINAFFSYGDAGNAFVTSIKQKIAKDKYISKAGKSVLNVRINESVKFKLDKLIEYHDKTQTRYLESLINQAYDQIKDRIK